MSFNKKIASLMVGVIGGKPNMDVCVDIVSANGMQKQARDMQVKYTREISQEIKNHFDRIGGERKAKNTTGDKLYELWGLFSSNIASRIQVRIDHAEPQCSLNLVMTPNEITVSSFAAFKECEVPYDWSKKLRFDAKTESSEALYYFVCDELGDHVFDYLLASATANSKYIDKHCPSLSGKITNHLLGSLFSRKS